MHSLKKNGMQTRLASQASYLEVLSRVSMDGPAQEETSSPSEFRRQRLDFR